MVHRISGHRDGERRRSLHFLADFASVGAFFSTLLVVCRTTDCAVSPAR